MATGFRQALDLGVDLIAKIDSDGQHDPYYLDRFVRVAAHHDCDYVKANRFGHIEALPSIAPGQAYRQPGIDLSDQIIFRILEYFRSTKRIRHDNQENAATPGPGSSGSRIFF